MMKMKIRTIWVLALAAALPLGAASTTVSVDYDHHVNFSSYRTFSWGKVETGDPLWDQRVQEAIERELAAKRWTQVPSGGDLLVEARARTRPEQRLDVLFSVPDRLQGGCEDASATMHTYEVGTLVVEMIDARSENLVWRGTSSGTLSPKPEKTNKQLDHSVRKMFRDFPPGANGN